MRVFWIASAVLIGTAFAGLMLLPGYVENSMNQVKRSPGSVRARGSTLAAKLFIADMHADSLLWGRNLNTRSTRGHVDVPRLIEGNVALQAFTIVTRSPRGLNFQRNASDAADDITLIATLGLWPPSTWRSLTQRALYQAGKLQHTANASGGRLAIIRTRGDLDRYMELRRTRSDITAGLLGVEGAHALDGRLENLDALFDAGVRMMAHTHFFDNDFAGAAAGAERGGLTQKGRELVRRMEQKHMLIDVAHVSEPAIDELLTMATRPVVSSHTGVKGTCNNSRNLSDRHLRAIAATGGFVSMAYFDQAVCGSDTAAIARAIRHAADVAGVDHVALGSDFDGAVETPFDTTGVGELIDALMDQKFNEVEVAKIAGGNVVRVLRSVLPE